MKMRMLIALLLIAATLPVYAYDRDDVLLYVPFDGSFEPAVAAEGTEPVVTGEYQFDEGMIGQSVRTGAPESELLYPTAGNMKPEEGTFAVWVHSRGWTLADAPKINRWWIGVTGPSRFLIYHYMHSGGVFFYHMDERGERPSIIKAPGPWEADEWKHLAGTWKNGRLKLFINGEKVPEELQVELGAIGEHIRIGGPVTSSEAVEAKTDTNLDEFYVFGRALEDVEVRALYLRGVREHPAALAVPSGVNPAADGTLADAEWASAAAVSGFSNEVTGLLDSEQSTAWLGHDGTNLHFAHRWPIPERVLQNPDNYSFGAFRAEAAARDGSLLVYDDLVGIELTAQDGRRRTLMMNAQGFVGDWFGDGEAAEDWTSLNADVQAGSRITDDAWIAEISVPLSDLGITPGETVGLRIIRQHALLRPDTVAWPSADPTAYAEATVATAPGAVQLTSVGDPAMGAFNLRLNASGTAAEFSATTDSGEVAVERTVAAGESLSIDETLPDTSVTSLRVEATAGDRTLLSMVAPFTYPPMLEVDHYLYPSKDLLEVIISTRGAASAAPASVVVTRPGGDEALQTVALEGGAGDSRVAAVDVSALQPGEYQGSVTVGEGDRALGQREFSFTLLEKPEWIGTDAGVINYVPEPWTPIEYDGSRVSVWGRSIELGDSLLPARIASQGEELLAGPVALVAAAAGAECRATGATFEFGEQTDQRATWRTSAMIGPVQADVEAWMEFDGLMWFELTLSAEQAATLESLRLEIPFAKEHSTLLYSGNYRTIDTGATPSEPWVTGAVPAIGLSNEERGMQWLMESRKGWNLANPDAAVEVIPGADTTTLAINFMDQPTEISEPRTIAFGLHPAPIKPPLEGRRMLRPLGKDLQPQPNISLWQTNWSLGCSYALPVAERMHDVVAQRHGLGWRTMLYTRLAECSVKGPWYGYFRDEWRIDPGPRMAYDPDATDWGKANPVCQNSQSWQDWTAWSFREAFRQTAADGVYYDVSRPAFCMNAHHGCGFINERGEREPEYQLLGTRELQKRMWVIMHEQLDRECMVTHHMSGDIRTATQSFSDAIIDGENFTGMLKDNYYELLPLDKFRAEFMGHQWGLTSIFLPEFSRAQLTPEGKELYESPEKLPEVRHLAGMIFLHDSIPWPAFSDLTPYGTIWAAQDELGWGDEVEFLPYWNNADVLAPMGEELVASIFRNNGRLLIVLFNNTDEAQQAPIKLDLAKLGVQASTLRDFETREAFTLADGATEVPIVKRNFRLLLSE